MRPYPSWVNQWLCAYMMEMIATSFFFAYCVSNFECYFLFANLLDKGAVLSYNTTPAEGGRGFLCSLLLDCSDHMFIISRYKVDHIWWSARFFPSICVFLLFRRSNFRALLPPQNDDHISIIRHSDLTTSLTINRTGVHGDKMSREYEKAVFA